MLLLSHPWSNASLEHLPRAERISRRSTADQITVYKPNIVVRETIANFDSMPLPQPDWDTQYCMDGCASPPYTRPLAQLAASHVRPPIATTPNHRVQCVDLSDIHKNPTCMKISPWTGAPHRPLLPASTTPTSSAQGRGPSSGLSRSNTSLGSCVKANSSKLLN